MKTEKIGFIGGGNMATSLISGLIASGHSPKQIWVSDVNPDTRQTLADKLEVNVSENNDVVINESDVVVIAVKPQVMKEVTQKVCATIRQKKPLIVSIAAGITQSSLSRWLGEETAIVRSMPNTPALVLTGATALHANHNVSIEQQNMAENIMRSVGIAIWVKNESQLDAVTAVSGSGPAYFFLLMEAMEKTAEEMGLNETTARLLVQQTALGAAKIALESSETPEQLRQRVASPGGTTQKAIEIFQEGGFADLVTKAIHAARNRSVEMAMQTEQN